jgi:hypothetical protein
VQHAQIQHNVETIMVFIAILARLILAFVIQHFFGLEQFVVIANINQENYFFISSLRYLFNLKLKGCKMVEHAVLHYYAIQLKV